MKPKQAKEVCNLVVDTEDGYQHRPVCDAFEFNVRMGMDYWKCLRVVIEAVEKAGFAVSITKDGKEYNK